MPDNPRIEELRRRVHKDPASIAFAQLAEEHRRAGDYGEAIRVSRNGLAQHPGYLSARVTLGRALLEVGEYDEAQAELEHVLRTAPDNLAAIRALAEIHQRRDDTGTPPEPADVAEPAPPQLSPIPDLSLSASEDQFAQALQALDAFPRDLLPGTPPSPGHTTTVPEALDVAATDDSSVAELALEPVSAADDENAQAAAAAVPQSGKPDTEPGGLADLEAWLSAILAERTARE